MAGKWAMAGLAIHMRVLAGFLHIQHVRMAVFARLMPGKLHRTRRDFSNSIAAIVAVLPETTRYHVSPDHKEHNEGENEESRETEKMPGIPEDAHPALSP